MRTRDPARANEQTTTQHGAMRRGKPVFIELSADQVSHIVRAASDGGHVSTLLSGLDDTRAALATGLDYSRLSGSLLCGLSILAALPADGSYVALANIARLTGKNPSTTHRYLSTLLAVCLVERDPATREYRLAR